MLAVTQGWLYLVLAVLWGMWVLTASVRVVLNIPHSSSVVAMAWACCMLKLRSVTTSFRLSESALAYKGILRGACFFFCVLTLNSQKGMLQSDTDRPGTTSMWGISCGQLVRNRSRMFSSLVGSCTSCSKLVSLMILRKSWWSWGHGDLGLTVSKWGRHS